MIFHGVIEPIAVGQVDGRGGRSSNRDDSKTVASPWDRRPSHRQAKRVFNELGKRLSGLLSQAFGLLKQMGIDGNRRYHAS